MRKLVVAEFVSLDDVMQAPGGVDEETDDLPKLAAPARRALAAAGIQNLKQLTIFSEAEIKQLHGIGPNALKQLQQALTAKGWQYQKAK